MTITAVSASQLSNTAVEVTWNADADAVANWQIRRDDDGAGFLALSNVFTVTARRYVDLHPAPAGVVVTYRVVDDLDNMDAAPFTMTDLEAPFTYGPVDALAAEPRYTTLAAVKARMSITHTESDVAITSSIVAAEYAIDVTNGRSFPDIGTNPEWPGIPQAIANWATDASIAVWKAGDEPHGQGGSDAWLGALDTSQITERVLRQHPLAQGFTVAAGFGVA